MKDWKQKYDDVGSFYDGRARVRLKDKYGHVDKNGKVTTQIKYDYTGSFYEDRALVRIKDKYGHVDKNGKVTWNENSKNQKIDNIRKIYCEERIKKDFDKIKLKELKNLCGWVDFELHKKGTGVWTVSTLFEDEYMDFDNQQDAEIYANTEMIKGMLLKNNINS